MAQDTGHEEPDFGLANFRIEAVQLLGSCEIPERLLIGIALLARFHQPQEGRHVLLPGLMPALGGAVCHSPVTMLFRPGQPGLESLRVRIGATGPFIESVRREHLPRCQ